MPGATDDELATLLLETLPALMADMRERVRAGTHPDLKFGEFRALAWVGRHEGATLSQLADHLGLSRPAASRLVQSLVKRGLIARQVSTSDRRAVSLYLGAKAKEEWTKMRRAARSALSERLAPLTRAQREQLAGGLRAIQRILAQPAP